jgi:predicted metal-dependent phosphoesterase TrpH
LGKADLHIHSNVSDGMASVADIMEFTQENTDLDLIAIADHDRVDGSLEALEWVESHPDCRFRVVFATEITAHFGRHLLAYFFKPPYPTKPLPCMRSFRWTIELIHEMGGMVAIPHPTVIWTPSGGYRQLRSLVGAGVHIDGIEVCNAAIGARGNEGKLRLFNGRDFHLAEMGGSDAHHLMEIGSAYTTFKGKSAADFEKALINHKTRAFFGKPGCVSAGEHARQVFKSWVEKPTRGLRGAIASYYAEFR